MGDAGGNFPVRESIRMLGVPSLGVPSLPLELGLSLLYTILLKNILEHSITSICFHHVPSVSENFHCVISRHKCDFWSHSRIFSNLPSCSPTFYHVPWFLPECSVLFLHVPGFSWFIPVLILSFLVPYLI